MDVSRAEPSGTSVEVEFQVRDRDLFFVRASSEASCRVALAEMVHRSDGRLLEYFTVEGASQERVLTAAGEAAAIDDARSIREDGDEGLYEFVVAGPCIGGTLADVGALIREVVAVDGVGRVVAEVPPHADTRQVAETVADRHGAELVARRQRDRVAPEFTGRAFRATLADALTDRQLEALRTAYASDYFAWPRGSTAEECADALGISQPTFTQHLRAAQEKLSAAVFDAATVGEDFGDNWVTVRSDHTNEQH
jgi:predicted DNA binding protein